MTMHQTLSSDMPIHKQDARFELRLQHKPKTHALAFGRVRRYAVVMFMGLLAIWLPITIYLNTAPLRFTSEMSLILPGSGASASINLNEIGQASSYANSAFSNGSVSPTETYKRLLGANRILNAAAVGLNMEKRDFGAPRIELVDQTALIHVEMTGNTPDDARQRNAALLKSFFSELDKLRSDELSSREDGGQAAIEDYHNSVSSTRAEITALQRETGLNSAAQYKSQIEAADILRAKVDTLRADLQRETGAVEQLQLRLGTTPEQAGLTLRLYADITFMTLEEEVAEQNTALADARAQYGAQHPKVVKARTARDMTRADALDRAAEVTGLEIAELEGLDLAPDGERAALLAELVRRETERNGLATQLNELRSQLVDETKRLTQLAPAATELEDTQRDFDVAEAVFASAIARSQTSKTDIYASYPLVQVLEDPSLPDEPSSPRRMLALAAGIAASLMLMIGLMLGWARRGIINQLLLQSPQTA